MPRSFQCAAIVLRAYDVGEADRFCILFTRERGRLTARASGVRRPMSRMGGTLLPLREVQLSLNESRSGMYVSSASPQPESWGGFSSPSAFAQAHQGIELLLSFVQHEEPLPELYEATRNFLSGCTRGGKRVLLCYSIRLLHVLGFLPDIDEVDASEDLAPPLTAFMEAAAQGLPLPELTAAEASRIEGIVSRLLKQHLTSPLKSPGVASAMG